MKAGTLLRLKILDVNADGAGDTRDIKCGSCVDVEGVVGRPEGENSSSRRTLAHTAAEEPEGRLGLRSWCRRGSSTGPRNHEALVHQSQVVFAKSCHIGCALEEESVKPGKIG